MDGAKNLTTEHTGSHRAARLRHSQESRGGCRYVDKKRRPGGGIPGRSWAGVAVRNGVGARICRARGEASTPRNAPKMPVGVATVRLINPDCGLAMSAVIKVGMIQDVEGLGADLQFSAFPAGEAKIFPSP